MEQKAAKVTKQDVHHQSEALRLFLPVATLAVLILPILKSCRLNPDVLSPTVAMWTEWRASGSVQHRPLQFTNPSTALQDHGNGSHQNESPMSGSRRIENDMAEAPDGNQKRHLVLIRHGESELNVINRSRRVFCGQFDTPLTAHGREQAQAAGRLVAANPELKIRHAVSASLQRARETLDLIMPELANGVQLLPTRTELNERSLGLFEGRNEEDVFLAFPHYRDDVKFNRFGCDFIQKAPGGENLTDVSDRAWQCIQGLWQAVDGDLLIVSHHITMRCILGRALHLTQQQTIDLRIPNALPIILRQNDLGDFVACDAILTK